LPTLLVSDLAFIALHKALRPALDLVPVESDVIALVNPQFEVGQAYLGSGGIVRDTNAANQAVEDFKAWLIGKGWQPKRRRESFTSFVSSV